ncbi:MAG: hypothetical protein D6794_07335, partial [Deltaproteobacteria bacterium]
MTLFSMLVLSDDLMWTPRLTAAARQNGMQAAFIGDTDSLWDALGRTRTCGVPFPSEALPRLRANTA